jgi:hypothetical protein
MNTINITELEMIGLKSITQSDFYENGRRSCPWDFAVFDACPLKGKTRSGVFSSLSQKGLIKIYEKMSPYIINENGEKVRNPYYERGEPNFGSMEITELGYTALDELGLIDEWGYFIK